MSVSRPSVLVTGASSGIGSAITQVLIENGFHVFGTVRKESDASRLKASFGESVSPLIMDVTDPDAIAKAARAVRASLGEATLAGLVNNAGIAVTGPLVHLPLEDFRHQIEVNLTAPLAVTQAFAPLLGTDRTRVGKPGRIINISSVSGQFGPPFMGAYAASKHGLEGMSESLRRELLIYGIDVILIGPGWVKTPIIDKAEAEDFSAYRKTDYGPILDRYAKGLFASARQGLEPEIIGRVVLTALTTKRPKLRYAVVKHRFFGWTLPMLLPKRWIDLVFAREFGKLPR